jgi:cold shock CspA family protein
MLVGRVVQFDSEKGFGFLAVIGRQGPTGEEVFFHLSDYAGPGKLIGNRETWFRVAVGTLIEFKGMKDRRRGPKVDSWSFQTGDGLEIRVNSDTATQAGSADRWESYDPAQLESPKQQ